MLKQPLKSENQCIWRQLKIGLSATGVAPLRGGLGLIPWYIDLELSLCLEGAAQPSDICCAGNAQRERLPYMICL